MTVLIWLSTPKDTIGPIYTVIHCIGHIFGQPFTSKFTSSASKRLAIVCINFFHGDKRHLTFFQQAKLSKDHLDHLPHNDLFPPHDVPEPGDYQDDGSRAGQGCEQPGGAQQRGGKEGHRMGRGCVALHRDCATIERNAQEREASRLLQVIKVVFKLQ